MSVRCKRFFLSVFGIFLPYVVFADDASSSNFSPPPSDISVTFLGDIFGMVDGVLHGSGSQIMGAMFGVFNAGVLALGGIVIMYIIMVSTMNTAHEGQMLGQKWSSIWVPTRAVIGLALLIPKTSGYCLMQIFVMWVVLQGVGVADKIWNSALDYMNRGGVIIQANMAADLSGSGNTDIITGASKILYGQVCMQSIQTQLEAVRETYMTAKDKGAGACAGTPSSTMAAFCKDSVPDFINTVSPLSAYEKQNLTNATQGTSDDGTSGDSDDSDTTQYSVPMPNFSSAYPAYQYLNGICGTIKWSGMDSSDMKTITKNISGLSSSDIQTIEQSRASAIEQVYIDLAETAKAMVSNDPQMNPDMVSTDDASAVASEQYGVALKSPDVACENMKQSTNGKCSQWGAEPDTSYSVLFQGTELKYAVADYDAVMSPTLNLLDQAKNHSNANSERKFISGAESSGWIMAGSYFFDLAKLNGNAATAPSEDSSSGFDKGDWDISLLTNAFTSSGGCTGAYANLCTWFGGDSSYMDNVVTLINGSPLVTALKAPDYANFSNTTVNQTGVAASTVYGYAYNASLLSMPGDVGTNSIDISVNFDWSDMAPTDIFPSMGGKCHGGNIFSKSFWNCIPTNGVYILVDVVEMLLYAFFGWSILMAEMAINVFIVLPMYGFTQIFQNGVDVLSQPGVNPIVALAKMGITFIDFSMNTWIEAAMIAVAGSFAPGVFAVFMITAPLFLAWQGVMLGLGFLTAYFVPFLPYMIFTFGVIAWLMTVIEAMVAAPIVALGIAHPEGHDALGKSEQGLMILLNVFLRPGMMIIGYIAAISLSFVGVWIMNAGFQHILDYLKSDEMWATTDSGTTIAWAKYFGSFTSGVVYTMMYLSIVQKSFSLIAILPDKVLRWIGGQPEGIGQETMQWSEETKSKLGEANKASIDSAGAMQKGMAAAATEAIKPGEGGQGGGGSAQSTGGDSGGDATPPPA